MISVWHTVLHGGAAGVLLAIGIPFLLLSARTSTHRPWRTIVRPAGDVRPALFAAATIIAIGGVLLALLLAARTPDAPGAAGISTVAAALGAFAMHAVRRASFNNVLTVPLAGLVSLTLLLAVAGPSAPAQHAAHESTLEVTHAH